MRTATEARRDESWRGIEGTEVVAAQDRKILDHLSIFGPMTSREIAERTGIERTSVVRALNGLVPFYVSGEGETICPVTRRRVTLYRLTRNA